MAGEVVVAGFLVFVESFGAAFAAESGVFDTAEGCCGVGGDALVDADKAGFEGIGDVEGAVEIVGEHVAGEAVLGRVGPLEDFGLGGEALDSGDGAEDLAVRDVGVGGNVIEHGGREVVARAGDGSAAGAHGRSVGDRVVDKSPHVGDGAVVDEGAEGDVVGKSVAGDGCRHSLGEAFNEGVGDALLDVDAVGCDAGLAPLRIFAL